MGILLFKFFFFICQIVRSNRAKPIICNSQMTNMQTKIFAAGQRKCWISLQCNRKMRIAAFLSALIKTLGGTMRQVLLQGQLCWMKLNHIQSLILQLCMSLCHCLGLLKHKPRVWWAQFVLQLLHKAGKTAPGKAQPHCEICGRLGRSSWAFSWEYSWRTKAATWKEWLPIEEHGQ